jgi:hypothetical protein
VSHILITELTEKCLKEAVTSAQLQADELFSCSPLEGIIKGQDRSGWIGIIHVGLWPTSGEFEKKYIIHTSLEGNGRTVRNVELDKITGFFMAKYVMKNMYDSSRTVYTPAIKGQKIVYDNKVRQIRIRDVYVNYEPRHLAFTTDGITPEEYASYLGRDIVRFLYVGMTNAPRHVRPNFARNSIRKTCMIDLDQYDPRTFHWNPVDRYSPDSINYAELLKHETVFFHDVALYFLNNLLPNDLPNRAETVLKLKSHYADGAIEEIKNLKGSRITGSIVTRLMS